MTTHIFHSLRQSSADIRLLWFSVFVRMVSFGLTNQVVTLYLTEIGISEVHVGWFMSLTMIGDSIISYLLTWNAHKIGNRFIMLLGSALMILASAIFASGTKDFNILLFAAIIGVISPSGNDTGPFKTIEETVLANLTPPNHRPEIYAIHSVLGYTGASVGSFTAGLVVDHLTLKRGFSYKKAYRYSFYLIVFTSVLKFLSLLFVSSKAEPSYIPPYKLTNSEASVSDTVNDSICEHGELGEPDTSAQIPSRQPSHSSLSTSTERTPLTAITSTVEHTTLTGLSPSTQRTLFKLLVPFMLDSFGYGFTPNAWVVYYFERRYHVKAIVLGVLFGTSGILMSASAIPSAWFAKRFGPIKSSIFTQIPCGIFFMLIPILGVTFPAAAVWWMLNQLTTGFDVVPRQIILTSLIEPTELTKVMGTVNIGKQVARSVSPYFTGYFAEAGMLWVCFIITGVLLILANVILAIDFADLDNKVRAMEQQHHDIV